MTSCDIYLDRHRFPLIQIMHLDPHPAGEEVVHEARFELFQFFILVLFKKNPTLAVLDFISNGFLLFLAWYHYWCLSNFR